MKNHCLLASLLISAVVPAAARADEPKFEFAKPEEINGVKDIKDVEWKAQAAAGLVLTTGNSRSFAVTGSINASRKDGNNKVGLEAAAAFARSETLVFADKDMSGTVSADELDRQTQTTAENWVAKLRYDRFFADTNSAFASGRIGADELAGKELFGGGQVGYSRQLVKNEHHELVAEAGYDFTYESYVNPTAEALAIHSARLFAGYLGKLGEETGLSVSIEALFNLNNETVPGGEATAFEDTRLVGKAAITTKLAKRFDLRVAATAKFDNTPAPLPAFAMVPFAAGFTPLADKLDFITEVQLIVSIL